jgi:Fur family transcriptional regulator, peroxide stress response regulator
MATHSPQSRVAASRVNEIVGRLRERGDRLTPQRYAVVRALVEGGEHPSAEQLFHRVSDAYPMMSRATVYKTLDTLNAAGEVLELEFREGPNRYDANIPSAHPHVVCTGCGRIDDVRLDRLGRLSRRSPSRWATRSAAIAWTSTASAQPVLPTAEDVVIRAAYHALRNAIIHSDSPVINKKLPPE